MGLASAEVRVPPLGEFIESVSPALSDPTWLGPLKEALERAFAEESRLIVNVPPQHGKTETILHALAREIRYHPERTHAYASYGIMLARSKSRRCRQYARQAGVEVASDADRMEDWRTPQGGGLLATGVGGALTGEGVSGVLVVDDPIKSRKEADSRHQREVVWGWFGDVANTRVHPGASIVVVQTRWHEDDLSGRLIDRGWELVRLPAIDADGHALWPEGRPLSFLEAQREAIGEHSFAALYQQEPRPRGGRVFESVTTCSLADVPTSGVRGAGLDLAYTAKTRADWSVSLSGLRDRSGVIYVTGVLRRQCSAPDFAEPLRSWLQAQGCARPRWYAGGTEKAAADWLARSGLPVLVMAAKGDKFARAQPVAAGAKAGRLVIPHDAPWSRPLLDELRDFTGAGDVHDDQVDALAAMWDELDERGTYSGGHRSVIRRVSSDTKAVY